jgi:preprotein translocase subunit SecY
MDSLRNIFAIPELRKRVLFTFGILAAYRVGGHINTPGINIQALSELTRQAASTSAAPPAAAIFSAALPLNLCARTVSFFAKSPRANTLIGCDDP